MRHANVNHIVIGQKIHDKAVGQSLLSLYRRFCKVLLQENGEFLEADILERARGGRYLHDREIGKALKSSFECFSEVSSKKPMPHHILAP